MAEREVPQKVRDAEYAESQAENFFAAMEGLAVFGHGFAAVISIAYGVPELAPVFIATAAGMYKLSEKMYSNYHKKRESQASAEAAEELQELRYQEIFRNS